MSQEFRSCRSSGVLETGVMEYWSDGVLEYWSIGNSGQEKTDQSQRLLPRKIFSDSVTPELL
jgi:hypothetical protein